MYVGMLYKNIGTISLSLYIYIYIFFFFLSLKKKPKNGYFKITGLWFFSLKKVLLWNIYYIELSTRKI